MKMARLLVSFLFVCLLAIGAYLAGWVKPPLLQSQIYAEHLGEIRVTKHLWGELGLAIVFVDTGKFPADKLAHSIASLGLNTAIIDTAKLLAEYQPNSGNCLGQDLITKALNSISAGVQIKSDYHVIIAGIGDGALLPFINAETASPLSSTNISVEFSIQLADKLTLCSPLTAQNTALLSLKQPWRSVWTDHPAPETALFVKSLANSDTRIADYSTPLDTVLIDELNKVVGSTQQNELTLPVVEVSTGKAGGNLTLFYSGDGGWRDLDRAVAQEMSRQSYPVVGIDVLRYFWQHKTPEQAAADLTAAIAYYRQKWGIESFILAGYSFGADIMPAVYNRLSAQDQARIPLIVLLALGKQADFEIHVSGWLGKNGGELAVMPELHKVSPAKILCIYGKEEQAETGCTDLQNTAAHVLELPGGHHFDQDYPKLTQRILADYNQHGIH